MPDDDDLAALALTSRLVDSGAKPLSSREFWQVTRTVPASSLRGMTSTDLGASLGITTDRSDRIAALFERAAGIAFAMEKLDHDGIWTITGSSEAYPARLRARLGDAAPVVLHGVGNVSILENEGVGVVGSRDATQDAALVARDIARFATKAERPIVSGNARGIDREAMNGGFEAGGSVVGVLADSLQKSVNKPATRRAIADGRICLVTPFAPTAPFSVGNAMGRNKLIYALSAVTVVVTSEQGSGGTWAGATEALKNRYGLVAAWTGPGSAPGNAALIEQGASELSEIDGLGSLLVQPCPDTKDDEQTAAEQLTLRF